LKLLFDLVPVVQKGTLIDSSPGTCSKTDFKIVACSHEVHEFGHEPHEGVADQIFLHHFLSFGVAAFCGVAGDNVSIVVDQKTCLLPKGEIFRIKSRMCLIDDWDGILDY
jgi:hypothetical protein